MSLFDAVLASLNDPSRATQQSDLESLASAFSGGGASSANAGQIANLIGGFLKPMLQEQHAVGGAQGVDSFLQDIKQSAHSPDQLRQVLGADRMDQMVGRAEQKTGLDASVYFPSPPHRASGSDRTAAIRAPRPHRLTGPQRPQRAHRLAAKQTQFLRNFSTPTETATWIWPT